MTRSLQKLFSIALLFAHYSSFAAAQGAPEFPTGKKPPPESFELPSNTSDKLKQQIKKTSETLQNSIKKVPVKESSSQKDEQTSIVDQAEQVINQVKEGAGKPSPELLKEQTEFYKRSIERATGVLPKKKGTQGAQETNSAAQTQTPEKVTDEHLIAKQEPATVQLIVSGMPVSHLQECLDELESLKRTRHVQVKDVVIADRGDVEMSAMIAWQKQPKFRTKEEAKRAVDKLLIPKPYQQTLSRLNLIPGDIEQTADILRRLNAKSSPIWVIEDQGRQHIFEGINGIARYFTAEGFYIRPEIGSGLDSAAQDKAKGDRIAKNGVSFPRATEKKPYSGEAIHYQLIDDGKIAATSSTGGKQKITWHKMADLPNCSSSQVRKQEVGHYSPISSTLDFVAFQGTSAEQRGIARSYKGSKVPYWSGAFPQTPGAEGAISQFWASTVDIRCLPTRFRFVSIDGRRYAEYREGEIAWSQVTSAPEQPVKATTTKIPATTVTTTPSAPPATVPKDDGIGRF